jgi:hypothetical protein
MVEVDEIVEPLRGNFYFHAEAQSSQRIVNAKHGSRLPFINLRELCASAWKF